VKRAPPTSAQATATVSAGNRTLAFTGLSPSVTARASTDGASGGPFSLQISYMATPQIPALTVSTDVLHLEAGAWQSQLPPPSRSRWACDRWLSALET
jgi:hypothetical protein